MGPLVGFGLAADQRPTADPRLAANPRLAADTRRADCEEGARRARIVECVADVAAGVKIYSKQLYMKTSLSLTKEEPSWKATRFSLEPPNKTPSVNGCNNIDNVHLFLNQSFQWCDFQNPWDLPSIKVYESDF